MPMYRYRCSACGAHEEHLQKVSDPPLEICASCGGALAKQLTSAAFHLKGGGWYKDLYASAKPGEGGAKPESTSPSADAGGGKSDSGGKSDAGGGKSDGGSTSSTTPAASSGSTGSTGSSTPTSSSAA
jgi:putative FmdB family regulatory protein